MSGTPEGRKSGLKCQRIHWQERIAAGVPKQHGRVTRRLCHATKKKVYNLGNWGSNGSSKVLAVLCCKLPTHNKSLTPEVYQALLFSFVSFVPLHLHTWNSTKGSYKTNMYLPHTWCNYGWTELCGWMSHDFSWGMWPFSHVATPALLDTFYVQTYWNVQMRQGRVLVFH